MSGLQHSIKSKIILCQEWLETLDREEFLRLFIHLKPRGLHGNFKSQVWNYYGALCRRNYSESDEFEADFTVLDDNFNYCRLCLAKQQHMLKLEEQEWTCGTTLIKGLANSIKCYRINTATGALSDHLLHDHGLEYSKKNASDMQITTVSQNDNGQRVLKSSCFSINQDILLLQEVMAHNPFSSNPGDVTKVWEKIAKSVIATDEDFVLDGHRCYKRTNLLIDLFKQDDVLSLRSIPGTDQQFMEREQLLQRIVDMEQDGTSVPVNKKIKTENEEGNGIDGWDILIDTSLQASMDDMHGGSTESSDETVITSRLKPKKHERLYISNKSDLISLSLAKKELEIREKELAFKREQLELQKQQLQFDRDRFAAEQQERLLRYQAEKEERDARLMLESEERRTLMEILKNALIKQ